MAKNRAHEQIIESNSDSSDDDSSQETRSQESDSEPELTQKPKKSSSSTPAAAKKPQRQSVSKPQEAPPTSSFESGSDSESDPDGPSPNPTQKSINGARKSRSKSSESKKKAEPETSEKPTDDPKKTIIQRVWCEEDEIVILQGLADYSAKKKANPFADLNDYHEHIKKDLRRKDFTKSQLQEKIRRLKKKYENTRNKEKSKKEITFPNQHEQKAYELSKSVWGNKNVKENGVEKLIWNPKSHAISLRKAAIKRAGKEEAATEDAETESLFPAKRAKSIGVTVEERILSIGNDMFENGKGGAEEKEWKKLRMEEMQVYLRHLEVKSAQARIVIEHLQAEGV